MAKQWIHRSDKTRLLFLVFINELIRFKNAEQNKTWKIYETTQILHTEGRGHFVKTNFWWHLCFSVFLTEMVCFWREMWGEGERRWETVKGLGWWKASDSMIHSLVWWTTGAPKCLPHAHYQTKIMTSSFGCSWQAVYSGLKHRPTGLLARSISVRHYSKIYNWTALTLNDYIGWTRYQCSS